MKIQLASTLPFSPVQLDPRLASPRRSVGLLSGFREGMQFSTPVYEFRHGDNDTVSYKVGSSECFWVAAAAESMSLSPETTANDELAQDAESDFVWIDHDESLTYKPYAFLVMDAMTRLVGQWDGVVYRTPSGERLRESAFAANLQVVDACVSRENGLWVMVSLTGESATALNGRNAQAVRQVGWVPVAC